MGRGSPMVWVCVLAVLLVACDSDSSGSDDADAGTEEPLDPVIAVTSTAFAEGTPIPPRFTCDGDDVSPPLAWADVPEDAAELALVVDDPDAPSGTYVHWVLFGLDPSVAELAEGQVPAGARQATNSGGDVGYRGPCPPEGDDAHRYRFTVYALSQPVTADDGAASGDVLDAVRSNATAEGTLTATFER